MRSLLKFALLVLPVATVCAQTTTDPVQAIIAAFDRVNLVALGEHNHLSTKELEFRLRLIRDPAFARKVNDIVIEFANPIHQSVLDRFTDGEDVTSEELDRVWTVYKQKSAYAPFYQQFVDAVRTLNRNLPPERRVRVVAGDGSGTRRDQIAADQIRREVLDKNRKALVVFGGFHFLRKRPEFLAKEFSTGSIVMLLQNDPRARWFVVQSMYGPDLPVSVTVHPGTPEKPALITDRTAQDMDAAAVGLADRPDQFRVRDLVDAMLYFGGTALPSPR
jgi:hypothetical protein